MIELGSPMGPCSVSMYFWAYNQDQVQTAQANQDEMVSLLKIMAVNSTSSFSRVYYQTIYEKTKKFPVHPMLKFKKINGIEQVDSDSETETAETDEDEPETETCVQSGNLIGDVNFNLSSPPIVLPSKTTNPLLKPIVPPLTSAIYNPFDGLSSQPPPSTDSKKEFNLLDF